MILILIGIAFAGWGFVFSVICMYFAMKRQHRPVSFEQYQRQRHIDAWRMDRLNDILFASLALVVVGALLEIYT